MHYYHVLLKNVPQLLTYQSEQKIPQGSLVQVTLGKKPVNGIIISQVPQPEYTCVNISEVYVEEALTETQLRLCQWMAQYYCSSLQKCISLFVPTPIWNQKTKPKKTQHISLKMPLTEALEQCSRSKKQQQLLRFIDQQDSVSETVIKEQYSSGLLKAIEKKELLIRSEGKLINPDKDRAIKPHHQQPLTEDQQQVLSQLLKENTRKTRALTGHSTLIHGITGSGKTEVYLQVIKKNIEAGKQCLLLVPEIALTTELIQHFTEHFPHQISIIHSHLSERERVQSWHRIHSQESQLILGSRSSLFTPWKDLGAIIIDEEHEWTYKQESSPRYHAKKVAQQLKKISEEDLQVILGSATPSLETYYEHQQEDDAVLEMTNRTNQRSLPPVTLVDLREEYHKKNFSMFSEPLQEAIQKRLEKKEQVVLFLNKRGNASSVTCRDCGYTPHCDDCDISLTYHGKIRDFQNGGLICHYCGHFRENPINCPECKSSAIRYFGSGTQKAEEQLQELYPEARILRADRDSTSGKYDFEKLYHQMLNGEADILLGTQMIAKGLDLPEVTLTGVLLADIGLHIPDFRASERIFQLMTQVAGRSGRHKPGEVIIQSYQPDHPALQAVKKYDYLGFYEQELAQRKLLNYPPFSKCIKLIFGHENPKTAEDEAIRVYGQLHDIGLHSKKEGSSEPPLIELAPHYISKLHGKYLWNIFIRGENPRTLIDHLQLEKGWKIDVDPS